MTTKTETATSKKLKERLVVYCGTGNFLLKICQTGKKLFIDIA